MARIGKATIGFILIRAIVQSVVEFSIGLANLRWNRHHRGMDKDVLFRGDDMRNANIVRWAMGLALAAFMIYAPYQYYRYTLENAKRLRPVVEGRVYRSGLSTSNGFREAIEREHIKTVINFMEEAPDPDLFGSRFDHSAIKESELCRSLGVKYHFIWLKPVADNRIGKDKPGGIDEFLKVMDDESAYPVLFHCKAGLHRTGAMAALYRIEYQHWSPEDAMRELKSHGFGHFVANTANELCLQYVLLYKPRWSGAEARPVSATAVSRVK